MTWYAMYFDQALRRTVMTFLICLTLLSTGIGAGAGICADDPLDVFSLEYGYIIGAKIKDVNPISTAARIEPRISDFRAMLALPLFLSRQTTLVNRFIYADLHADWDDWNTYGVYKPSDLHSLYYSLELVRRMSDDWTLTAAVRPGLSSDFKAPSKRDAFRLNGSLLLTRRVNDDLLIGFGAAYTTLLGRPLPLPMFRYDANFDEYRWDVNLPYDASLLYYLSRDFAAGITAAVDGEEYTVDSPAFDVLTALDKMRHMQITVAPVIRTTVNDNARWYLKIGYTVFRRLEGYLDGDKVRELNLKNAMYFKLGVIFNTNY